MSAPVIEHDAAASAFVARVEGGLAECAYRLQGDVMNIVHTEVPPASEGRGIAAALVQAALAYARAQGLRVRADSLGQVAVRGRSAPLEIFKLA